jgi:hypothetical protein
MANKTQPSKDSVADYLNTVEPLQKREDCFQLLQLMENLVGEKAKLWGNMIGIGTYHYKYDTGREGDSFIIGFAPRSKNISIYTTAYNEELDNKKADLGKVKLGKSCIYINKWSDINEEKMKIVLSESIRINKELYP